MNFSNINFFIMKMSIFSAWKSLLLKKLITEDFFLFPYFFKSFAVLFFSSLEIFVTQLKHNVRVYICTKPIKVVMKSSKYHQQIFVTNIFNHQTQYGVVRCHRQPARSHWQRVGHDQGRVRRGPGSQVLLLQLHRQAQAREGVRIL